MIKHALLVVYVWRKDVYLATTYLIVYKLLNSILVTDINCIKIDRVVDVCPHVVVTCHMMIESLEKR